MGWRSPLIGSAGEGLFQHLAYHWDAIFVPAPAPHTDGYLFWPEMEGVRLAVQIKSAEKRTAGVEWFDVDLSASNIRDWARHRPLLVLCIISEHRAWWIDTRQYHWQWEATEGQTRRLPLTQPVDETTKTAVQRIALRHSHHALPFVFSRHERTLADISPDRVRELLRDTYQKTASAGIIERDFAALAIARTVYSARATFRTITLERYLELVIDRLFESLPGGRSFTLGALAALLRTRRGLPIHSSFIPRLAEAASRAITARTFITPELGMLIAASLHDRFPQHPDVSGLVEYLVLEVQHAPQNPIIKSVAQRLSLSLGKTRRPLSTLFEASWVEDQITRPLCGDEFVLIDRNSADAATARALRAGVVGALPTDLQLADQLIRLKAYYLVDDWIWHS
jgi:hypothetical protein